MANQANAVLKVRWSVSTTTYQDINSLTEAGAFEDINQMVREALRHLWEATKDGSIAQEAEEIWLPAAHMNRGRQPINNTTFQVRCSLPHPILEDLIKHVSPNQTKLVCAAVRRWRLKHLSRLVGWGGKPCSAQNN